MTTMQVWLNGNLQSPVQSISPNTGFTGSEGTTRLIIGTDDTVSQPSDISVDQFYFEESSYAKDVATTEYGKCDNHVSVKFYRLSGRCLDIK